MVAIDWKDIDRLKKDVIFDHPSYANMNMEKKNDTYNLRNCLNQKLEKKNEERDTICCSTSKCSVLESIKSFPPRLNVKIHENLDIFG